ncbi:MAG: dimethyl sulfoxide reductase anchor subunit [Rhodospirillaceae bacterium]|jgi:phenylacetyl-CoA:acceptor oxidoreductase 26-kDa subunit|nr:dimethyl sulfoxide reductase anchor subunit [Rhodospirillaceae bacterium]MBT4490249.1 dimethyl sulfoxide reductase anchor subunit [Rhodospirillaceae bacterium]MBT5897734.1 dimethyl sulfoxide reductase anchor subunit [Rhodospirillaceae bacterium]MBT6427952.1 dimethyl sulfoxide reductase anchor subunit [Rhodospirillaceae bacterium]
MSRIEPWHQGNWDWRAAGNFIGGGSGTGLVILAAFAASQGVVYWPLGILGAVLVGIGLFCVWLEIGRPWRALHVFFHPQTSWMTREAFVSTILLPVVLLAAVASSPHMPMPSIAMGSIWCAAILAALYLYCQARILHASKGIPAWRHPSLMPVIIITGLTEGCGVIMAGAAVLGGQVWLLVLFVVLLLSRWLAWRRYMAELTATGAPSKALAVLNKATPRINILGHFAPGVLILLALIAGPLGPWLAVLAGLAAIAGGWRMKFVVIARAAFNQGFALPLTPVRGAGEAGPGGKPGWSKGS